MLLRCWRYMHLHAISSCPPDHLPGGIYESISMRVEKKPNADKLRVRNRKVGCQVRYLLCRHCASGNCGIASKVSGEEKTTFPKIASIRKN